MRVVSGLLVAIAMLVTGGLLFRAWAVASAGRAAHAEAAEIDNAETRCKQLGADCICSEPLQVSGAYEKARNPEDSGRKECSPGGQAWTAWSSSGEGVSRWPIAFPPGSQVTHVLSHPSDFLGGQINSVSLDEPAAGKTICAREYLNWDVAHPTAPVNIKLSKMGDGSIPDAITWQFAVGNSAPQLDPTIAGHVRICHVPHAKRGGWGGIFESCTRHWCRIEACADYDGSKVGYRARIEQVGGEASWVADLSLPPGEGDCDPRAFEGLESLKLSGPFFVGYDNENRGSGGVFVSHAMFARTAYDPTFWIGKACEIEGC